MLAKLGATISALCLKILMIIMKSMLLKLPDHNTKKKIVNIYFVENIVEYIAYIGIVHMIDTVNILFSIGT